MKAKEDITIPEIDIQLVHFKTHQDILKDNLIDVYKMFGIYFTPDNIINFMLKLIDFNSLIKKNDLTILEPACALAQFLIEIKKNIELTSKNSKFIGVEINSLIVNYFQHIKYKHNIEIINEDFLLWKTDMLFDLIIGNPPYGIPANSHHYPIRVDDETKDLYKQSFETWFGKYNLYGAFIEKSIKLLKPNGQLIFIVPATFLILDEFKKLREYLAQNGNTSLIYMGPNVFKPEADVASIIINFQKENKFSHSLTLSKAKENKIYNILDIKPWRGEVVRFESEFSKKLENTCSFKLKDIFEVKISPRTSEIRENPKIIKSKNNTDGGYLSLLNGKNLKCNDISYENLTGYIIKKSELKYFRGYYNTPHIVIGLGFRENGGVAAGLDKKCYPWMGDVYHLIKKDDLFIFQFDLDDNALLEYLNSNYVKKYIKDIYREITYHLSITQIMDLPLPTREEWAAIKRIKL